jgi:class 3 adenylate cyclase/ligand-binding sensor domain-containing protein
MRNTYRFFLTSILALLVCCQKSNEIAIEKEEPTTLDLQATKTIRFADFPDSLQPKSWLLTQYQPPRTIRVPKTKGEVSYKRINIVGQTQTIDVDPPKVHQFDFLTDVSEKVITDSTGRPIVTGKGGKSQFKNYTVEDGLAFDGVNSLMIDKRGDLWIGTLGGGVSKFDGFGFTNYTTKHGLPNNSITRIFEDSKGNIWFASNSGGVSMFDGKKFIQLGLSEGMPSNNIWSITEDIEGNMWFGTFGDGIIKYDGKLFENFKAEDGLSGDIFFGSLCDMEGNLWFGGAGGLNRISGGEIKVFSIEDGLPFNAVFSLKQKVNGELWIGTFDGLSTLDGESFKNFFVKDGLSDGSIWGISEDELGNLWLGTSYGISKFDGKKFTSHRKSSGLIDNGTRDILAGRDGAVWIATKEAGLSRLDGEAFTNFNKEFGLSESAVILDIHQDNDGNIWFGSMTGLYKYDGLSLTAYGINLGGLKENEVDCSFQDRAGNMWFGGPSGISKFDGVQFFHFGIEQGFPGKNVKDILQDSDGFLWFAIDTGIARFDGETFTHYTLDHGAPEMIKEMYIDTYGNFWITSWEGLTLFDQGAFYQFGRGEDLLEVYNGDVTQDEQGNLWLGTYDGLFYLDASQLKDLKQKPLKEVQFKVISQRHGLIDQAITQLLFLPDGRMAVGSPKGIQIFDRPELTKAGFSEIKNSDWYHTSTGFPVRDITSVGRNTMFLDKDGSIWAATESGNTGLVRFDYKQVRKKSVKPKIRLRNLSLNGSNVSWHSIFDYPLINEPNDSVGRLPAHFEEVLKYGAKLSDNARDTLANHYRGIKFSDVTPFDLIPQELVLPYRFNRVTFEFGTDELTKPELIEYQYFLEGYDKGWSTVTKESKATFGNIKEGTYTFLVRARFTGVSENGADEWTEPLEFTFEVLPPWYRTWWAYLSYALLFVVIFRYYIKRREWALRKRQEELEETVSIRTSELRAEKKKSDDLLLNILPEEVAEELKAKGNADAQLIDQVTVLFTDFKGFTQLSEKLSPKELVAEINECFSAFDLIMEKYGIEKIKTIGDAYMAAGGLPTPNQTHAIDVVKAALDIQKFMKKHKEDREARGDLFFEIRIGINTGPVVAGIVGVKKFQYDIWGDTVNTASRMESSGEIGKVNISGTTYELVKDRTECFYRGKISAKGKGDIDMYFVERVS